ncbi:MAG: hypothetical protein O2800_01695 [Planctomycetota bacterium]|nr:hypothetical protein [Planctomycetota bacterium]
MLQGLLVPPLALLAIALTSSSFDADRAPQKLNVGTTLQPTSSTLGNIPTVSEMTEWDRLSTMRKDSARLELPKDPRTGRSTATGRIIVKLREDLTPRASILAGGKVHSEDDAQIGTFQALTMGLGLQVRQAIDKDPAILAEVTNRISTRSGKVYPDLASFFYVEGAGSGIVQVARAFASMPEVTYVEIEERTIQAQIDCGTCGDIACGGTPFSWYEGPLGPPTTGVFTDPVSLTEFGWFPGVNFVDCCTTVGAIQASCTASFDEGGAWDQTCVGIAELLCTPSFYPGGNPAAQLDTCIGSTFFGAPDNLHPNDAPVPDPPFGNGGVINNGYGVTDYFADLVFIQPSSMIAHTLPGSNLPACCAVVCANDFLCCTIAWDENCVALALGLTALPPSSPNWTDPGAQDGPCYATVLRSDLGALVVGDLISIGNKLTPDTATTPFYNFELLGVDPATEFPLTAPVNVDVRGTTFTAPVGSIPLGLWGTSDRAANDSNPNPAANNVLFDPFRAVTNFRAGGLDMRGLNALIVNSTPSLQTPKIFGAGIKVGVLDRSAYVNHEEFLSASGVSVIQVETGIPLYLTLDESDYLDPVTGAVTIPPACAGSETVVMGTPDVLWPHHGTAVLGVLFAAADGKGVSGLCTGATEKWFFPTLTAGDPDAGLPSGDRTLGALLGAIDVMTAAETVGSVPSNVCIVPMTKASTQPMNTGTNGEVDLTSILLSIGADGGMTWVLAAGNGASAVEAAIVDAASGIDTTRCVVAGACWPGQGSGEGITPLNGGINYGRVGESNYDLQDAGTNNLITSAWGRGVTTCGYGDLYLGDDAVVTAQTTYTPDCYEQKKLRSYTATFTGTSAAVAQIGGLIACLQAHAKTVFDGIGLPAAEWRNILQDPLNRFPQAGQVTPPPIIAAEPALGDAEGEGNDEIGLVQGFPNARNCGLAITQGNWVDLSNDSDANILVGRLISGNTFSLKRLDGALMRMGSTGVAAGAAAGGYGSTVFYPSIARATDLQVKRTLNVTEGSDVSTLRVQLASRTSGGITYAFVFVYNARIRRYDLFGFSQLTQVIPAAPVNFCVPTGRAASDYVVMTDPAYPGGLLVTRVVTGGYGMAGQYQVAHDLVALDINNPLILVDPCQGFGP